MYLIQYTLDGANGNSLKMALWNGLLTLPLALQMDCLIEFIVVMNYHEICALPSLDIFL